MSAQIRILSHLTQKPPQIPISYSIQNNHSQPSKLDQFLLQHQLDQVKKEIIIEQIGQSLKELHQANKVHRNIKPESIFVFEKHSNNDPTEFNYQCKIDNLGYSKQFDLAKTEHIGTPGYMAPEILNIQSYSKEVDIWAFGVVIYEIFTSKKLFQGLPQTIKDLTLKFKSENSYELQQLPSKYIPLVRQMLQQDPKQRPNIDYVLTKIKEIQQQNKQDKYIIQICQQFFQANQKQLENKQNEQQQLLQSIISNIQQEQYQYKEMTQNKIKQQEQQIFNLQQSQLDQKNIIQQIQNNVQQLNDKNKQNEQNYQQQNILKDITNKQNKFQLEIQQQIEHQIKKVEEERLSQYEQTTRDLEATIKDKKKELQQIISEQQFKLQMYTSNNQEFNEIKKSVLKLENEFQKLNIQSNKYQQQQQQQQQQKQQYQNVNNQQQPNQFVYNQQQTKTNNNQIFNQKIQQNIPNVQQNFQNLNQQQKGMNNGLQNNQQYQIPQTLNSVRGVSQQFKQNHFGQGQQQGPKYPFFRAQ